MIRFESVSKRYGHTQALSDATFRAPAGQVTGFLGPNGAGKSTAMRILTGLSRLDTGTATIGGRRFVDLPMPGRDVGVMLDAGAQHPGRTGISTLRTAGILTNQPRSRVHEVLDQVGLTSAGAKKVGQYSLGMRQRLGIGVALMGRPSVLILDEPANGLDPEGIRWMRNLLKGFAANGGTVFLSSHLLSEVSQIADRLVVVAHGRIVAEGTQDEIRAGRDLEETFFDLTRQPA